MANVTIIEMSRRIIIDKYQGNTHYSVHIIDSYGTEHHLGYYDYLTALNQSIIERNAEENWRNYKFAEFDEWFTKLGEKNGYTEY